MATFNFTTFSNNTVADANAVTTNFQNIKNFVESQTVQVDGSVKATESSIADGAVTAGKIGPNAVVSGKIAANAVNTAELADDAVTAAKVKDNETLPVNISGNAASANAVDWANVSSKPAIGDVFNNGGTYSINITGSSENANKLDNCDSSSTGLPSTIVRVGSDGLLAARKFAASPDNASWWYATDWIDGTLFRVSLSGGIYGNGFTGGRTVVVSSAGTLGYSTSSIRYKKEVEPAQIDCSKILEIEPVKYLPKEDYSDGVNYTEKFLGVIAEQVDSIGLNYLVEYNEKNEPESFKYEVLSVALLAVLKEQDKKIKELEAAVESLKK